MRRQLIFLLALSLASPAPAWATSFVRYLDGGAFQSANVACSEPDSAGRVYCIKLGTSTTAGSVVQISADGTSMVTDAAPTCSGNGTLRFEGINVIGSTIFVGCGSTTSTFNAKYTTCATSSFGSCSWSETSLGSGSCYPVPYACGVAGWFDTFSSASIASLVGVHNTEATTLRDGSTTKASIAWHQYSSHVSVARAANGVKVLLQMYSAGYVYSGFNASFSKIYGVSVRNKSLSSADAAANYARGSAVSSTHLMGVWKYGSNSNIAIVAGADGAESLWWAPSFAVVPGVYGAELTGASRFAVMKTDGTCYVAGQDPPTVAFSSTAGCNVTPDGGETIAALFKLGTTPVVAALTSGGDVWRFADAATSAAPKPKRSRNGPFNSLPFTLP